MSIYGTSQIICNMATTTIFLRAYAMAIVRFLVLITI